MTCSIAWMDKETGAYGVIADRLCVGPPYSEATYRDKTAFARTFFSGKASSDFCLMAFAGDTARMLFIQKLITKGSVVHPVMPTVDAVENFLLSLHKHIMTEGPATPTYPSGSGNSGVQIVVAHKTGVYKYEGAAIVHAYPVADSPGLLAVSVGSAAEYVEGFFAAASIYNAKEKPQRVVYDALRYAAYRLPHAVSRHHNSLERRETGGVYTEDEHGICTVLIEEA